MDNWPLPPFFKEASTLLKPSSTADAIVFAKAGGTHVGQLVSFDPEALSIRFKPKGEFMASSGKFSAIKSIHLMHPITLVPDTKLIHIYQEAVGQSVSPAVRPFVVTFSDDEQLKGHTKGFIKTRFGLFVFLTTVTEQVVPIFIPQSSIKSYQVGDLLGEQLVFRAGVKPEVLDLALAEQARRRQAQVDDFLGDSADALPTYKPTRLADILMEQGLVSREQLSAALRRLPREKPNLLGNILVEMGVLTRSQLTQAVADQLNIPAVPLRDVTIDPAVLALVPKNYAFAHHVLPLLATEKTLVVAVESPLDADYLNELRLSAKRQIAPVMANAEEISARIAIEYANVTAIESPVSLEYEIGKLAQETSSISALDKHALGKLQVSDNDTVLVRMVNKMVEDAHKAGASDIHIEAYEGEQPTRVRFRIDGVLSEYINIPHNLRSAMISRIKIMANMDISEHRKPQDGKIDFSRFAPLKLELRVASLPTSNGLEDIVMRLLASSKPIPLDQLGCSPELNVELKKMVHHTYGLILVCGPTGSGKTTTLHSLLAEVNTVENKIWTAEDPIEITHPGLRQIQMIPRAGLTFASAMRAFLRADPDIIMVGEMRDTETTHMAIEASLTGHLVLSTLHTNSAPESVVRLLDMGLDPFNFSDALVGVLSQRLARKLCGHCKTPMEDSSEALLTMAHEYCHNTALDPEEVLADWMTRFAQADGAPPVLYQAPGCEVCAHTGHKGRVGIYELMTATPAIKKLIQTRSPVEQLLKCAVGDGMLTLKQYGVIKVLEGVTDLMSVQSACN